MLPRDHDRVKRARESKRRQRSRDAEPLKERPDDPRLMLPLEQREAVVEFLVDGTKLITWTEQPMAAPPPLAEPAQSEPLLAAPVAPTGAEPREERPGDRWVRFGSGAGAAKSGF